MPSPEREPTVGHDRFVTDSPHGMTFDDSQAVGEFFDTSEFDHLFTADELADTKKSQGRK
jgi:hypothetical protein